MNKVPELALYLFLLTLVVPLFVLGGSGGDWRAALKAWGLFGIWFGGVLAFGAVVGLFTWLGLR